MKTSEVTRAAVVCLVLLLAASVSAEAAEPSREMVNLMPNSGFEQANENGVPAGWWHWPAKLDPDVARVFVDDTVAHSGKSSAKIEIKSKANVSLIYTTLKPLNQGDTIHLSIYYRSNRTRPDEVRNANDYSSNIGLVKLGYHFRGAYVATIVNGEAVTDGWEKLEATFPVIPHHESDDFNELTIKLLMQDGLGDIWWDDLVIKKLNRYSVNLAPYGETVPLGKNRLSFVLENYTGAKEPLRCELSLGDKVIAKKSFIPTSEKKQTLTIDYTADTVGKHAASLAVIAEKDDEVIVTGRKRITVADMLETSVLVPTYVWQEKKDHPVVEKIKVSLPPEQLAQSELHIAVTKDGKTVGAQTIPVDKAEISYRFPVQDLAPGDYVMDIILRNKNGNPLATRKEVFHVMDRPQSVLSIKDGIILRDGKPFFPIGMYGMGTYNGTYKEFADAGFNFVHSYAFSGHFGDEATLASERSGIEQMDRMAKDGMLILMETPRFKLSKGDVDGLRAWYQAFSNHPACLFYYEEESFIHGHASYENALKWQAVLREVHPEGLILLADWLHIRDKDKDPRPPEQKRAYGEGLRFPEELCDIGVDYWYPFPLPEGQTEIVIPGWLKYHMDTTKPIIVVPQSNKRHWITNPPERAKRQRWPLPEEYRVQAYLSIIHGSVGLFYFGHHFVGQEKEAHWEELKALTREIQDLSPIILSPTVAPGADIAGTDKIDTVLKDHHGDYYLIAAYRDVATVKATITLPFKPTAVEVVNENRTIAPAGNSFADTFKQYAVHIYRITRERSLVR